MDDIDKLVAAAKAVAAEEAEGEAAGAASRAVMEFGKDAKIWLYDRQYASDKQRLEMNEDLKNKPEAFQIAVEAVAKIYAEEFEANAARIARVRAENPTLFKGN